MATVPGATRLGGEPPEGGGPRTPVPGPLALRTASGRFGRLFGASAPIRAVYEQIARVAPTSVPVFIVTFSRMRLLAPMMRRVRSPLNFRSCGTCPSEANG